MRASHVLSEHSPLMKTYYDKLADIFWASSNFLFHAYSLDKLLLLAINDDDTTDEQRHHLANSTALAALIVSGSQVEEEVFTHRHEGAARLAQLLGFKKETPSRAKLLQLLNSQGILAECNDVVQAIYDLLENRFLPLSLSAELAPLLQQLSTDERLSKYVPPLQQLVILRVLQQLSTVFKSIKVDKFLSLVPPTANGLSSIERLIMQAISSEHLSVRIDHQNQLLLFPDEDLESSKMRDQLVHLSRELCQLADRIEPVNVAQKLRERQHVFSLIAAGVSVEHESVYRRQEEIEKRKQESERVAVEKEKREAELKATAAKERKAEEARRLEEESRKREQERLKKEAEEKDLQAKQQLAQEINKKVEGVAGKMSKGIAVKAAKKMRELTADLEKIDRAALLAAQEAVLEQERKENERRRRETVRRIDYFTRACRLEEREVLIATAERKREEDRVQLEADFERYVEEHRRMHEKALTERERLQKMKAEKEEFFAKLVERRKELQAEERAKQMIRFEAKKKEHDREERRKREEEQVKEREKEKRAAEERERLEKEAQKLRLQEEATRKKEEERARREQERLDIIENERRKEEEFEKRRSERRAQLQERAAPVRRPAEEPAADKWRRGDAPPPRAAVDEGPARRDRVERVDKEEEARQWRRQEEAAEAERVASRDRERVREHKEEKEWRRQQQSQDEASRPAPAAAEEAAAAPLDEEAAERQRRFGALERSSRVERDAAAPPAEGEGGRFAALRGPARDRPSDRDRPERGPERDERRGPPRDSRGDARDIRGGDRDSRDPREREQQRERPSDRFPERAVAAPGGPGGPAGGRFGRDESDRAERDRLIERRSVGGPVGERRGDDRPRDDRPREERPREERAGGDRFGRDDRGDSRGDPRGPSQGARPGDRGGDRGDVQRRPGGGFDRPVERAGGGGGGGDERFSRMDRGDRVDRGDRGAGDRGGDRGDRPERPLVRRDAQEEAPRKERDFANMRRTEPSPQP